MTVDTYIPLCGSTKLTPLGIWFNEEDSSNNYQNIEVTLSQDNNSDKYTASWSLSISNQIKPYYASNSVPVNYTDSTDVQNIMGTFSGVLSRVQELGNVVKRLQESIPHNVTDINTTQGLINRVGSQERMMNLLTTALGEKTKEILTLKEDQASTSLTLGTSMQNCENTVLELTTKVLDLGTECNNTQLTAGEAYQIATDTHKALDSHLVDYGILCEHVETKFNEIDNSIEAIQDDVTKLFEWTTILANSNIEILKKLQVIESYWPIISMFSAGNESAVNKLPISTNTCFMDGDEPVGSSVETDLDKLTQYSVQLLSGPNRNYVE